MSNLLKDGLPDIRATQVGKGLSYNFTCLNSFTREYVERYQRITTDIILHFPYHFDDASPISVDVENYLMLDLYIPTERCPVY